MRCVTAVLGLFLLLVPVSVQAQTDVDAALADRFVGSEDAPVTIIEYSSLTCPHCAAFHTGALPEIMDQYVKTGKVKFIVRDFPLDGRAAAASLLARCAPAERYFPLVDLMFKQQQKWSRSDDPLGALAEMGRFAGMGQSDIDACFRNEDLYAGILRKKDSYQDEFSIRSTPTFYINGEMMSGNQPFSEFKKIIESHLN